MQIIVTQKDDLLTSKELCLSSDISEAILYELVDTILRFQLRGSMLRSGNLRYLQ